MLVCRCAMRASLAFELRLGDAVFGGCIPTFLAAVRGVPGVDLNPDTPSIFRFGAQNRDEATPASVTDTSIEPGLRPGTVGQKLPRIVSDQPRALARRIMLAICKSSTTTRSYRSTRGAGLLVVKVLALVGDLAMPRRHRFPPAFTVLRTALGAGQPLLRRRQPVRRRASPARIVDMLTVAGGGETARSRHRCRPGGRCRQRIGRDVITGQHQHPAPPLAFDLDRLHPTRHLAVQIDLDLADALQIHPFGLGQPASAITVFGPLHTVEPALPLNRGYPGLTPGLAVLTRRKNPANALFNRRRVAC